MNTYLRQVRYKISWLISILNRLCKIIKSLLHRLFNKNIYTKILFTNVTVFGIGLIVLIMFSSILIKQITYDLFYQDLLRKAKRVNFALKQTDASWNEISIKKDMLRFLADIYDSKITLFSKEGDIIATSEEQEVVPGGKVEDRFIQILNKEKTEITDIVEKETGQVAFAAVIPMGSNGDSIQNGILLESKPTNIDLALNKMRLYLLIGSMLMMVVFIFISVNLAIYICRPISRLSSFVSEISRGNGIINIDEQDLDEINVLAGELNKLAVTLNKIQTESHRIEEEKARLFSEISHELRTPLTSVQGFVEAIRDGMVQDEALRKRYLDTIYTQTLHIARLVDDLLSLSRLESDNITVEKLPVDMIALAKGVVMSMEDAAKKKNTTILLDKKTENAIVIGDVDRMEQIIRNLLKNAIRATEDGTIRVGVDSKEGEIILTIEDNGIGIAPDDLSHIFDRFYRIRNNRNNLEDEKGSGLGLVIVKKLVQLQGGCIDVISQLGKGTIFTIKFPQFNFK